MKIKNDKYYTPDNIAEYIVNKTKEYNITEYLEPTAGNGVFLKYLPNNTLAYDIDPGHPDIIKQDFLKLDIAYKKGRCVIGNPPFGTRTQFIPFCNKAFEIADYVAFILPISQLNNNYSIYKFDLIYSEDLGKQFYTDRYLHCCFNIYKRPKNGLNKRVDFKDLDLMEIIEYTRGRKLSKKCEQIHSGELNYDIRMVSFGTVRLIDKSHEKRLCNEYYIIINDLKNKDKIINIFMTTDWYKIVKSISIGQSSISTRFLYKYIKEKLEEEE